MPRKYKRNPTSRAYRKHDPADVAKAVEAFESKTMSLRKAAETFGINYSVVYRHSKRKGAIKSQGGQPALNENEESFIVKRLQICGEWGYPLDSFALRMLIRDYLNASGKVIKRFKNNTPGKDFAYSFLDRHKKELSVKMCQNIKRSRAAVSPETLNEYFQRLEVELNNIPPENIVNYDETNLRDDPGKKKVIVKRGCKYPERVMNNSKSSTSLMFSAAGDGTMLPCYVVYKAIHLYDSWTQDGPKHTRYNRTKSGWFDAVCFEDWVRTVAVPYCKKLSGKKILIGDNLSSHISLEAINLCSKHDIHFIFLPPNSTHLTQPLDVAFFAPLKKAWRDILTKWKMGPGRDMSSVPKDKFPRLLNNLLKKVDPNASASIKNGFRKCGIIPINKEEVLKMLPSQTIESETQAISEREMIDQTFVNVLKAMRYEDTASAKKTKKSKLKVLPGQSVTVDSSSENSDSEGGDLSHASDDCSMNEESDVDHGSGNIAIESETIDSDNSKTINFEKIEPQNLKAGDWVVVNFIYSLNKAGSSKQIESKSNTRPRAFIGKLVTVNSSKSGMFEATFLRNAPSKEFSGFIYRFPNVEDISSFSFSQIIGKLRLPENYKRGLLKFDVNTDKL